MRPCLPRRSWTAIRLADQRLRQLNELATSIESAHQIKGCGQSVVHAGKISLRAPA